MAQLTIGEGGDVAWTPASTTAAGYPGLGLRARYNTFEADADTIFHYSFSGNPVDWNAGVAGSVKDSGPGGRDGDPMLAYAATSPAAGGGWLGQSIHLDYTAWKDPHATVRVPIGGITIPQKVPFTFQWWMKFHAWPRDNRGGVFSPNVLDDAAWADNNIRCNGDRNTSTLQIFARNGSWNESDAVRGQMQIPYASFNDGGWHHFRFVNVPYPAPEPGGYRRYMYLDGVLVDSDDQNWGWTKDFTFAADHYLGHFYPYPGVDDRPYRWEAGINAEFDDVVLHKSIIDDVVSRWKCLAADNTACSAVQTVDFGMSQRLTGISWTEATPQADERLQSIEVDDGTGYRLVWEYGAPAVDLSGLLAASAFNIRLTQRHSTDTVHEFAHILQSLTLDYTSGSCIMIGSSMIGSNMVSSTMVNSFGGFK